jgi:hypothetical protein
LFSSSSDLRQRQAYNSATWCVLLYQDDGPWIGIRIKGGRQIFSFGYNSGRNEKYLRELADKVLKKLDDGEDKDEVRDWAKNAAKPA